ncbi:MAG: ATP-binding protein [Candidatus Micrarchaeia archaeon]|jgi:ATP-dependent Lon protease
MALDFETTKDVVIPSDPFARIIGQDEAVRIAKIISKQRRHLLLVGPPGTGKSMLAQAIAGVLPKPKFEISVCHNSSNPEKPLVEVKNEAQLHSSANRNIVAGKITHPSQIPSFVAEKLGFRCVRCGGLSSSVVPTCPTCGAEKFKRSNDELLNEITAAMEGQRGGNARVYTSRHGLDGKEEQVIYEKTFDDKVNVLTADDIKKMKDSAKVNAKKVIIPLNRSLFVQVSGASETELLGDIKHDPYGGHPQIGTPNYLRVIPGAIHEANEGVLYIDELANLGPIQKHILTAMQDKSFPIVGRNPTSSGASVRVDGVPCDFILVGSVNINDIPQIIPPLRSRIMGDGYEVLMNAHMPDNPENRAKIVQFVAQEILRDGKIPHATKSAVEELIKEAKKFANSIDNANGLTLRLRNLSGMIKMAGDLAVVEGVPLIDKKHVVDSIASARPIEEQIHEKYENWWKAGSADYGMKNHKGGAETA